MHNLQIGLQDDAKGCILRALFTGTVWRARKRQRNVEKRRPDNLNWLGWRLGWPPNDPKGTTANEARVV